MKKGIDFFVVGDYGDVHNPNHAEHTFCKLDEIIANGTTDRDKIDFIMTAGDNIYPQHSTEPTDEEFEKMLSFFKKDNLKDLFVYAVRGNHDSYFDWKKEIELSSKYSKWYMPSLYYKEEFDLGNGKKLGMLFTDSSLMLCSNFTYRDS